jgi:hypothetical protein
MSADVSDLHVKLGFFIASTAFTVAWNLDWRHYVRYWIGPRRRAVPTWLRAFLLVCMLGSIWQLVSEAYRQNPSLNGWGWALLDGLMFVGVFFAFDAIFRWRWGRPQDGSD